MSSGSGPLSLREKTIWGFAETISPLTISFPSKVIERVGLIESLTTKNLLSIKLLNEKNSFPV